MFHSRLDPIEQTYSKAYPNPDRKGCPGAQILRGLADRSLPIIHPARLHIAQCSPCFCEFRAFEAQMRNRKWKSRGRIVIGAFAVTLMAFVTIFLASKSSQRTGALTISSLSFENTAIVRGSTAKPHTASTIQSFPRSKLQLEITLPLGSDEGRYAFEICTLRNPMPLVSAIGYAKISKGVTSFRSTVDASGFRPGFYRARSKSLPNGGWHQISIQIR